MIHKKKFLFLALSLIFIFSYFIISTPDVLAADQKNDDTFKLPFIPAMSIPGFYTAGDTVNIDGASLANYIKAIYRYGGMFASIVAMFMLVYAGWQWLLAGGNSSKISQAKDKINGTLVGLVILFGGYLLLSLISKNLISFQPLTTTLDKIPCALHKTETSCPSDRCNWVLDSLITPNINEAACVDGAIIVKPSCSMQKDATSCGALSNICIWEGGECKLIEQCNITQSDLEIFGASTPRDNFALHCCAISAFGGGYSSYRYAIFGDRDFKLSCLMICGGGFTDMSLDACEASLGWGQ
ncbi:MAG: hypothetical protein QG603_727 [Patescibacteria group bacterium]|nr:hypothetical protein [Patescibacteria group bacterium]MDQ5970950.1 hypothetical protein [Patescibacteria group bacterium]